MDRAGLIDRLGLDARAEWIQAHGRMRPCPLGWRRWAIRFSRRWFHWLALATAAVAGKAARPAGASRPARCTWVIRTWRSLSLGSATWSGVRKCRRLATAWLDIDPRLPKVSGHKPLARLPTALQTHLKGRLEQVA